MTGLHNFPISIAQPASLVPDAGYTFNVRSRTDGAFRPNVESRQTATARRFPRGEGARAITCSWSSGDRTVLRLAD
jgi:hypothetical protein